MTRLYLKYLVGSWYLLGLIACHSDGYSPKPRAYHRLYFPQKQFQTYSGTCPFQFLYPTYAVINPDTSSSSQPCWMNIEFQSFNAMLHLSYYPLGPSAKLDELSEDAHTFAFKHTVKASYIDESTIYLPEKRVFGTFYAIGGNTASSAQFFLTDSTKHYLRAALYFNEKPKIDSLQPVVDAIMEDMKTMVHSLAWK